MDHSSKDPVDVPVPVSARNSESQLQGPSGSFRGRRPYNNNNERGGGRWHYNNHNHHHYNNNSAAGGNGNSSNSHHGHGNSHYYNNHHQGGRGGGRDYHSHHHQGHQGTHRNGQGSGVATGGGGVVYPQGTEYNLGTAGGSGHGNSTSQWRSSIVQLKTLWKKQQDLVLERFKINTRTKDREGGDGEGREFPTQKKEIQGNFSGKGKRGLVKEKDSDKDSMGRSETDLGPRSEDGGGAGAAQNVQDNLPVTKTETGPARQKYNGPSSEDCWDKDRYEQGKSFGMRERKLDQEMQRLFEGLERQFSLLERDRERRVMMDPRFFEEMMWRDQSRCQGYEDKMRQLERELEYYRQCTAQLTQEAQYKDREFQLEKENAVAKAVNATMNQLLKISSRPNVWQDPFVAADPKLNLDETLDYTAHHPLLSSPAFHALMAQSDPNNVQYNSPALKPITSLDGNSTITNLMDRYEDIKLSGYMEHTHSSKAADIMFLIKSVVGFYESHNIRVYEEKLSNQSVSTLMLSPTDRIMRPFSLERTTFVGIGATEFESTEQALQQAYAEIVATHHEDCIPDTATDKSSDETSTTVSPTESMTPSSPPRPGDDTVHSDTEENAESLSDTTFAESPENNTPSPQSDDLSESASASQ